MNDSFLGGRAASSEISDLSFALAQPHGNAVIRAFAVAIRKGLRAGAGAVTYDRASFERAKAALQPGQGRVLLPTHRSYLDFLLCSFLAFSAPELEIGIPHIAASDDFSRIKGLGTLLEKAHAFYLRRGLGKEDLQLTQRVHELVSQGATLEFFLEGKRSRSGQLLEPKRGLLRALQSTGASFQVLPIAISYQRVPEERVFSGELRGGRRPRMSLRGLLRWSGELARGKVDVGRIHIACGEPLQLQSHTDVPELARQVVAELQRSMPVNLDGLKAFLWRNRLPESELAFLAEAIEARGGAVVKGAGSEELSTLEELRLRWAWLPWFYPEANVRWRDEAAVQHHLQRHSWMRFDRAPRGMDDPRLLRLLDAAFAPVRRDFSLVQGLLGTPGQPGARLPYPTPAAVVTQWPGAYLPYVEDAFLALASEGRIARVEDGYVWSDRRGALTRAG
jgi:fatty acyl-CoA reductase